MKGQYDRESAVRLEAAGIKPPRDPARREKQLQKRIAQRRRATQCKIEKQRQIRDSRA